MTSLLECFWKHLFILLFEDWLCIKIKSRLYPAADNETQQKETCCIPAVWISGEEIGRCDYFFYSSQWTDVSNAKCPPDCSQCLKESLDFIFIKCRSLTPSNRTTRTTRAKNRNGSKLDSGCECHFYFLGTWRHLWESTFVKRSLQIKVLFLSCSNFVFIRRSDSDRTETSQFTHFSVYFF